MAVPTATASPAPEELWRHPNPQQTPMFQFLETVNKKHGLKLTNYPDLHRWSVDSLADFWAAVWDYVGITASKPYDTVLPTTTMYPRPDFFQGARLNFAENMLFPAGVEVDPSATALITMTEAWDALGSEEMTWATLRDRVRRCAAQLRSPAIGVHDGDVVAGFIGNHADAIVTMLAAASIGAVWTSISPDNGVSAVLDRLVRVKPKVLFSDHVSMYNGKLWPSTDKTLQIVDALSDGGHLKAVIIVDSVKYPDPQPTEASLGLETLRGKVAVAEAYGTFLASAPDEPLRFEPLPPSHPLYILYSSGTTGLPKAIIHTALGTLIQHKKELALHCSIGPKSRMLYYTTTSWMMWHWSVAALSVGASLVLYMGSPFRPQGELSLPKVLSDKRVTHFGTSAAYLIALESKQIKISSDPSIDLSALEAIYSTASPLPPSTFAYVYETFPKRVHLASITGGTDIISLFGAPCPLLPVTAGAVQCAGLGMAIAVADSASASDDPKLVPAGEEGDLVCIKPFPCEPLTFYDGDEKYRDAYFERFHGWWHHGDFVRLEGADNQSLVMLGRSDGVLKPSGVRFGSAEIYNIITRFFASEVEDSLCVGRRRAQDTDETVCLFVIPTSGGVTFDDLRSRIKTTIRKELSPRHVPGVIEKCSGIPRTSNGKKIEVAVKQILSGMQVKTNASVANPETLDWFRAWANSHR
ncbi:acetoacetyl-CoA synthetase [Sporothrix brasiliensis 5110]|uniref:Acetoacetyl-CoA synthetase n=1 Tax=Sporothrix brasiliensis 5110 TaxID=1398154 RepID=A0A0C2J551_9PEZI|nr:acetoacetyl-CoA synthetase [Sporothrix brasiliensis 5110]KIH92157.1 acetoacetyl-CoA synthetase [Sporothrix brasiliensis 5110]